MGRVVYPRGVEQGRFTRRTSGELWLWRAGCFGAVVLGGLAYEYGPGLVADRVPTPPPALTEAAASIMAEVPAPRAAPAKLTAPPIDHQFRGCDEARAIGMENIPASNPSYREFMDGDGDGLACEPYRRGR